MNRELNLSSIQKVAQLIKGVRNGEINSVDELYSAVSDTLTEKEKSVVCTEFVYRELQSLIAKQKKNNDCNIAYI